MVTSSVSRPRIAHATASGLDQNQVWGFRMLDLLMALQKPLGQVTEKFSIMIIEIYKSRDHTF